MPARILVADDSALARKSVRTLLESQVNGWYICAEAPDGTQALEKALQTKPDLIIIDFQMPLMDGLRTAERIAKFLPRTPILIWTVHKTAFLDAEAKRAGVREVISKSDPAALLGAVNRVLGKSLNPQGSNENNAAV